MALDAAFVAHEARPLVSRTGVFHVRYSRHSLLFPRPTSRTWDTRDQSLSPEPSWEGTTQGWGRTALPPSGPKTAIDGRSVRCVSIVVLTLGNWAAWTGRTVTALVALCPKTRVRTPDRDEPTRTGAL